MMSLELEEESGSEGSIDLSDEDLDDEEADSPMPMASMHIKRLAATSSSPQAQRRGSSRPGASPEGDASPAQLPSFVKSSPTVSSRVLIVDDSPGQIVFSLTSLGLSCTGCASVEEVAGKIDSGVKFEAIVVS